MKQKTSKKNNTTQAKSKAINKQRFPRPSNEKAMLKDSEALAKRIITGEIQVGDAQYELELNNQEAKYGARNKALIKTLNRFLPEIPQCESDNELKTLVEQDASFTPEEIKAAEKLLSELDIFSQFYEDFKLTGYRASRELTDDGLLLLARTLRHKSSGEYGHGKLATGKTEFYLKVASFFPLSKTLALTTFSEKFLFYAGGEDGNALKGFLLVLGEADMANEKGDDTFKQKYFRQLLTENRLTQGNVEQENKKGKAKYNVLNGPLTVVVTGVDSPSRFDPQTSSRLYCRHFKHSHESIRQVLESKADSAANPNIEDNTRLLAIQRQYRCAFTLLKKLDPNNSNAIQAIEIPFSKQIIFKKKRHTEADMRVFDRLIESIEASALLNQRQRVLNGTTLVADRQDYFNIKGTFLSSLPAVKGLGNDLIEKFLELLAWWKLPENSGKKSKREIYTALNVDDSTGKKWIYAWLQAELFEDKTESDKKTATRYYLPATNSEAIIKQIRDDDKLDFENINNNIIVAEKCIPSNIESQTLGAGDTLSWASTENNKQDQVIPSKQAENQKLDTCLSSDSLGLAQIIPSKKVSNSMFTRLKNACPADSDECVDAEEVFRA